MAWGSFFVVFFFTYGFPVVTAPIIKKSSNLHSGFSDSNGQVLTIYFLVSCLCIFLILCWIPNSLRYNTVPDFSVPWTEYDLTEYPWTDYLSGRRNINHSKLANCCFPLPEKETVFLYTVPVCLELWPTQQAGKGQRSPVQYLQLTSIL